LSGSVDRGRRWERCGGFDIEYAFLDDEVEQVARNACPTLIVGVVYTVGELLVYD
jgi:hypothetical protein